MSQFDFGNLSSPLSGTAFIDSNLEPWRDALHTSHSGSSRPSYAVKGTVWLDTTTDPNIYKMFDGTATDITIGSFNIAAGTFEPAGITGYGGSAGGTGDVITLTPTIPLAAYAAGVAYDYLVTATNTIENPTINISGLGTRTFKCSVGAGKVNLPVGALQSGMIATIVDDGTNVLLINIRAHNKSADIATATTVNLDNASGDYIHLTGTTTVATITLAEGVEKTCIADGAFQLTDSSTDSPPGLIVKGNANRTTVAGDTFVVRGEGNGTTRMTHYNVAADAPGAIGGSYPNNGYTARYYNGLGFIPSTSTLTLTSDRMYGKVFTVAETETFTRIGIEVQTAVSGNARLGIYNFVDGVPTTLVADLGTVSTSTTGEKEITISQALTAGIYVLAVIADNASALFRGTNDLTILSHFTGAQSGQSGTEVAFFIDTTFGVLDDPFGSVSYTSGTGVPTIWLRKV